MVCHRVPSCKNKKRVPSATKLHRPDRSNAAAGMYPPCPRERLAVGLITLHARNTLRHDVRGHVRSPQRLSGFQSHIFQIPCTHSAAAGLTNSLAYMCVEGEFGASHGIRTDSMLHIRKLTSPQHPKTMHPRAAAVVRVLTHASEAWGAWGADTVRTCSNTLQRAGRFQHARDSRKIKRGRLVNCNPFSSWQLFTCHIAFI